MNRFIYYVEITGISSAIALLRSFYGSIQTSYIALMILIAIDTFTGMSVAFKYRRFSSKGLCKLVKKAITYSLAILTVKLLEVGILTLVETTLISQIVVAFLQVTETISVLENLTLLGVPLPSNLITFLLTYFKIPGLSEALKFGRKEQKDISEIDDIIDYQIPTIEDDNMKKILRTKFEFWKTMAFHIRRIFEDSDSLSNDFLYYKIMSIMEIELKDMNKEIKEANIPKEALEKFEEKNRPRVSKLLQDIQKICESDKGLMEKRNEITDKIVILCYGTILSVHRLYK